MKSRPTQGGGPLAAHGFLAGPDDVPRWNYHDHVAGGDGQRGASFSSSVKINRGERGGSRTQRVSRRGAGI